MKRWIVYKSVQDSWYMFQICNTKISLLDDFFRSILLSLCEPFFFSSSQLLLYTNLVTIWHRCYVSKLLMDPIMHPGISTFTFSSKVKPFGIHWWIWNQTKWNWWRRTKQWKIDNAKIIFDLGICAHNWYPIRVQDCFGYVKIPGKRPLANLARKFQIEHDILCYTRGERKNQ